jgi:UDPglucose--hexose-1-phosphate uridylyltransferase
VIDLRQRPHRRYNPLAREWVLVSPHRTDRPWQGQVEQIAARAQPAYDPNCYLCPGNRRQSGQCNPPYESTFVFDNDFAALLPDTPEARIESGGLLIAESESGVCRVVCFSPDHSLALARMSVDQIRTVVDTLTSQFQELVARPGIRHVQIFENRGEMMGCSNPHPHCQIWANETVPNEAAKEHAAMREYRDAHESCLLCDYAALEQRLAERIVCKNESFVAMVPFWAVWPFEIMLLSRRHIPGLDALTNSERNDLASIMGRIGARYDNLFDAPFPYSMGFHQGALEDGCHLHAHYYPPLLRSATVRKFMVGYEILAMPQRDLTPESAAERLRATPEHIV